MQDIDREIGPTERPLEEGRTVEQLWGLLVRAHEGLEAAMMEAGDFVVDIGEVTHAIGRALVMGTPVTHSDDRGDQP